VQSVVDSRPPSTESLSASKLRYGPIALTSAYSIPAPAQPGVATLSLPAVTTTVWPHSRQPSKESEYWPT
jgi:hypothetical protein